MVKIVGKGEGESDREAKSEEVIVKEAHLLLHPIRFKMVKLLTEKPIHVNAISDALGVDRRLTAYHLGILEEHGFLSSVHKISDEQRSRGKALRVYTVTGKAEEVLSEIRRL